MKKTENFIIIILLFIGYNILVNSNDIMDTVIFGFNIWKNNIFPSLFPFFVLSGLLINYGFVDICAKYLSKFMSSIFKINPRTSFIFVMSMLTGFPSNAKYVVELLKKNEIDLYSANKILLFTHFSNPLFILGTVSLFLNSKKVAFLILIIHYLTNIIIGLLFRNTFVSNNQKYIYHEQQKDKFGTSLKKSILSSIDTLILILGTLITFLIITNILNSYFNFNPYVKSIISGTLEMTQGLKYLSLTSLNLKVKAILSVMFLSFGGISIHMQVFSILSDTKIKYQPYLIARLLHSAIAGILMYILFDFI